MKPLFLTKRRRTKRPVTCQDLARQKRFDVSLCCQECHADQSLLIEHIVTAKNPLRGRCTAMVCCHCVELLDDWYPGQVIAQLPGHEE
jgi:hypothetical protein